MVDERSVGRRCPLYFWQIRPQFFQQHCQDKCAGIIVGAVAFEVVADREARVLKDTGRIAHREQVIKIHSRQVERLFVQRSNRQRLGSMYATTARFLE